MPNSSRITPVIMIVEAYGGSIRQHNPNLPMIFWDDAAVTRGDGIFETILIRNGQAKNLTRHWERFKASARLLSLPKPHFKDWEKATNLAIESWYSNPIAGDGACTWTYTRGRQSTGLATG